MVDGLNFKDFVAFLSAFSARASMKQKIERKYSWLCFVYVLFLFRSNQLQLNLSDKVGDKLQNTHFWWDWS